ncbi:hypothetical protein AXK11_09040 [Cephaloticoccus primus]|uniref:Short-chain dehydrogenase n=1 Tax=Cephaloticoccus primus TaxID=1548207 RepID=A0A139SHP4_9BACT|nr:SDR family oxidoreductase [Cephaloticoccus primus]KXU34066.1 hypothetical protein AXK11_09040 [Cephaloticoccus primus]
MSRRVAAITGASRGIGRALAVELARCSFDVIGIGRDRASLEKTGELVRAHGGHFTLHVADLSQESTCTSLYESLPAVDLAIANAGVVSHTSALETSRGEYQRLLTVNTIAALEFMRESAKAMLAARRPGQLLVIASDAAYTAIPGMSAYVASKYAISGAAKVLERELAPTGIRVTIAYPGGVDTEMTNIPEQNRHRVMAPADVARTLVHTLLAMGTTVRVPEIHLQPLGQIERL